VDASTAARFLALPLRKARAAEIPPEADSEAEISDGTLLLRTKSGDDEALGLLFHRYARLVRSVGRRILRDDNEAEDLAQDVFLYIQRKCLSFDSSKGSARSWIVQVAYKRAIERRRYLTARHFYTHDDIQSSASQVVGRPTTEDDYSAETVFGRNGLEKVLGSLSEEQRETLRLHFFDGYSLTEISAKLAQPLGNIRHHYYRGLEKLRKQMFGRKVRGS
jgi:RNA polymerase sigma-70 factor (ECF subfamily)